MRDVIKLIEAFKEDLDRAHRDFMDWKTKNLVVCAELSEAISRVHRSTFYRLRYIGNYEVYSFVFEYDGFPYVEMIYDIRKARRLLKRPRE